MIFYTAWNICFGPKFRPNREGGSVHPNNGGVGQTSPRSVGIDASLDVFTLPGVDTTSFDNSAGGVRGAYKFAALP